MTSDIVCRADRRRARIRAAPRDGVPTNGVDEVEVSDDGLTLTVTFLGKAPRDLGPGNVRIDGGSRVTGIEAVEVSLRRASDPEFDDRMDVKLDRPGDTSRYRLSVVASDPFGRPGTEPYPGFDQRYHGTDFRFWPQRPTPFDCAGPGHPDTCGCPGPATTPAAPPAPVIDYTARDYEAVRRMLLDRLAVTSPEWTERDPADLGVTLVELLAYTADLISYTQDAVATEAYLDTARLRTSVRRHVRLIDYPMHDGTNARAIVVLNVEKPVTLRPGTYRFAAVDIRPDHPHDPAVTATVIDDRELSELDGRGSVEVRSLTFCSAPPERVTASESPHPFTHVLERFPVTQAAPYPEPDHVTSGQATRLTAIPDRVRARLTELWRSARDHDGLSDDEVTELAVLFGLPFLESLELREHPVRVLRDLLHRADRLLAVKRRRLDVLAARAHAGNVLDERIAWEVTQSRGPEYAAGLAPDDPVLHGPAAALAADPRHALPAVRVRGGEHVWKPRRDLLDSGPHDRHLVGEQADDGRLTLRFGDGRYGAAPPPDTALEIAYRVGGGPRGNIGAESITHLLVCDNGELPPVVAVRNPLPAVGGPPRSPSTRCDSWRRSTSGAGAYGPSPPTTTPRWPPRFPGCDERRRRSAGPVPGTRHTSPSTRTAR